MKNYLYVFIGGAAGGLLRVMTIRAENLFNLAGLDLTVLLINLTGAFLLGLFVVGASRLKTLTPGLHLCVVVGLFGSLTTFSTLAMEVAVLFESGNLSGLALYLFLSFAIGLGVAELGYRLGAETARVGIGRHLPAMGNGRLTVESIPIVAEETEED